MNKLKLTVLIFILAAVVSSCDEEFFGPGSLEGTWRVTETSEAFGRQTFPAGIGYYPGDDSRIIIDNFSNLGLGVEVVARVTGLSLTIPSQTVIDSHNNSYRISGSGTITSNLRRINCSYRIDSDDYTAEFNKQ